MRFEKRQRGFTLIEMLVAAALLALVVSAAFGAFAAAGRSTARGTVTAERLQQGRVFLERIGRQIRCAALEQTEGEGADMAEGKGKKAERVCFQGGMGEGDGASICFLTTASLWPEAGSDSAVYEASYRFDRREGVVWYAQRVVFGGRMEERQWQRIGEGAAGLEFLFFDGTEWRPSWGGGGEPELPAAVRVNIEYTDGAGRVAPMGITIHPVTRQTRETGRRMHETTGH